MEGRRSTSQCSAHREAGIARRKTRPEVQNVPQRTKETAMNRTLPLIMFAALSFGYQAANAAPAPERVSEKVHFADLDLNQSGGAGTLYRRLKQASENVCRSLDGTPLKQKAQFKACTQTAMEEAVSKADQPQLTAYYRAHQKATNASVELASR
jgi:UrcA family protein